MVGLEEIYTAVRDTGMALVRKARNWKKVEYSRQPAGDAGPTLRDRPPAKLPEGQEQQSITYAKKRTPKASVRQMITKRWQMMIVCTLLHRSFRNIIIR